MLDAIKELFISEKDYAGRRIDLVIERLAAQTQTDRHSWSYLREENIYENTISGLKIYPHEVARKVV